MQKIYDWKNKLHTVEMVVSTDQDDSNYRNIEAVIDGKVELMVSCNRYEVPQAMHNFLVGINYFLDGYHNPSHYTGQLAGLAR